MDWKTAWKPIDFCENWRNQSGPVSSVFSKPTGEIWFFFEIWIFKIKFLKKLESISRFLVKIEFKIQNKKCYKIWRRWHCWKNWGKKNIDQFLISGQPCHLILKSQNIFCTCAPLPRAAVIGFPDFSLGRRQSGLPYRSTGKLRFTANLAWYSAPQGQ
jgi:hypothetical protein